MYIYICIYVYIYMMYICILDDVYIYIFPFLISRRVCTGRSIKAVQICSSPHYTSSDPCRSFPAGSICGITLSKKHVPETSLWKLRQERMIFPPKLPSYSYGFFQSATFDQLPSHTSDLPSDPWYSRGPILSPRPPGYAEAVAWPDVDHRPWSTCKEKASENQTWQDCLYGSCCISESTLVSLDIL